MNCSPTLTADEFKIIHNALCDLESINHRLEDILKPELFVKLAKAASEIRKGLEGAYEQDHTAYNRKNNLYSAAKSDRGFHSVWSIYEVDDLYAPHPFADAKFVVYDDHWGERPVRAAIPGSRWIDLWRAADDCISMSSDGHHVFIEKFKVLDSSNGTILQLWTGS